MCGYPISARCSMGTASDHQVIALSPKSWHVFPSDGAQEFCARSSFFVRLGTFSPIMLYKIQCRTENLRVGVVRAMLC